MSVCQLRNSEVCFFLPMLGMIPVLWGKERIQGTPDKAREARSRIACAIRGFMPVRLLPCQL